jgi:N-acetylglucosamine kinase-like BadF-type ATPase
MASTSCLLLGTDGGGSKTRAVLADEHGAVLGEGLGGSSNYQIAGDAGAVEALDASIAAAFASAGLPRRPADFACFGLGGADTPDILERSRQWATSRGWAREFISINDGMLPLYAACPDGQGVALIAGTGAIMWGQTLDGRIARSSGWGYLFGDEGSGWDLGHEALRHAARAVDGRGPATQLVERVLMYWKLSDPYQMIDVVYRQDVTAGDIAALARLVLECAAEGDAVALQIARNGAAELALGARAIIQTLSMALPQTLAYAGSLLIKNELYRELFAQACRELIGEVNLAPVEDPTRGAIAAAQLLYRRSRTA